MTKRISQLGRGASTIAFAIAATSLTPAAWAQDAQIPVPPVQDEAQAAPQTPADGQATTEAEPQQGGEIVVTGSRLGRTAFNSPTPVNVIGQERQNNLAIPSVADALNQLPSFRATSTPSSQLFRVSGAIAGNTVDLRGLGPSRTLTLIDGRRFVPSTDGGTVDLNGIPSALVQRTEVVTGGASAAYGADAVAGVVNLILDTRFTGLKLNVNAGISEHGDAKNFYVSMAGGRAFAGGRGHVIAGIEYQSNFGVGGCDTRAYCRNYTNYVNNPGYIGGKSTNGLPATLVLNDVRFVENPTGILVGAVQTVGGVNTTLGQQVNNTGANRLPGALQGLQFNAAGNGLVPFQFGNYLSGVFMQGGDASVDKLYGFGDAPLVTESSHLSIMTHATYDITDDIEVFGEFLFSNVRGGPVQSSVLAVAPASLNINNPYIAPAVRAQILAANPNITSINVNVAKPETGGQLIAESSNDIWRMATGIKGTVFSGWKWDVAYTHGETHSRTDVRSARLRAIDGEAINAITPPAGFGGPVFTTPAGAPVICASSVANPANGCIPVNLLGVNSVSPEARAKYFVNEFQTRTIKQDTIAANLSGSLFELWAGSFDVAIGGEYRNDSAIGVTDPVTLSGAVANAVTTALPPIRRKVVEGYVEASLPLLKDSPLGKSLVIDGALRQTHYNSFGDATTWKTGIVYSPISDLLVRVTKSRDIRAPNAFESNPNSTNVLLPLNDPFAGGTHNLVNIQGGNANLDLETADTFTAGLVLTPTFIPRFRASLDYYNIKVNGAIDTLSAPTILQACFQQNLLCNLIVFAGAPKASQATTVFSNFQNLSQVQAKGLELVAEYRIPDVVGGEVSLQVNANYVLKLQSIGATGLVTQMKGVTGNAGSLSNVQGVPDYKIDAVVTYAQPNWSVTAHGRYIPKSILDPTKIGPDDSRYDVNLPNSVSINTVSPAFYLDLSASVKTGLNLFGPSGMEIYGSVSNVFDKYPPVQLRFFGNPLHYDVVGRAYRIGFRTSF